MQKLIGHTPLIPIPHPRARILGKWEGHNLTGSSKDRAVFGMLRAAGLIPGSTVIEATSGNTGISLSAMAAAKNLRCIITMPENMSRERVARMAAYGAQIRLTPAAEGMAGAVRLAQQLAQEIPGAYYLNQFENSANSQSHYETTGPEIWQDTGGKADIFIAGVGTGGSVSGAGRYLKEHAPAIRVVAVAPGAGSSIPGLGAGFVPKVLETHLISQWVFVSEADAFRTARHLATAQGLLVGPSAGAALFAAETLANQPEHQGKTIVALLPDTGCRYLSTW